MSINPISITSPKDQSLLNLQYGNDNNYMFEQNTNEIKANEQNFDSETFNGDQIIISKSTIVVIILVSLLVAFLSLASLIFYLTDKIYIGLILNLIAIIFALIILGSTTSKISFEKINSEKILKYNIINHLGCAKKTRIFPLENIHFDVKRIKKNTDDGEVYYTRMLIINDFKNPKEINLDMSEVKNVPSRFYYYMNDINLKSFDNEDALRNKLNIFVNSPLDYKNPLFLFNNKFNINNLIQISRYFYTYYFFEPKMEISMFLILTFFLCILYIASTLPFALNSIFPKETQIYIKIIFDLLPLIFFNIINILCRISYNNKIIRIDFIFSNDYDRIFIGTVKRQQKSYKNKILIEISQIKQFMLEIKGSNVLFKILLLNSSIDICLIKGRTYWELEPLINNLNNILKQNNNYDIQSNNLVDTITPNPIT